MGVKGLLTTPSRQLEGSARVMEACRLMGSDKLGAVAVVDRERFSGIFTYRDLVNRVILEKLDAETTLLEDVMTQRVVTMDPDGSYGEALRIMVENDYTCIPVVARNGHLEEMLSLRELLEHRIGHLAANARR